MSPDSKAAMKNLKYRITSKGIPKVSEETSFEESMNNRSKVPGVRYELPKFSLAQKPATSNKRCPELSLGCERRKLRKLERSVKLQCGSELPKFSLSQKPATSNEHGREVSLGCERRKLRKLDRSVKLQCCSVLRELMCSHEGWIFNKPVEPLKLGIPDYFLIIKNPMDLGTIKEKLEREQYCSTDDFAADVRLTFSNAMLYNPPGHNVYNFARRLNGVFCRKWKLLDAKWNQRKQTSMAFDVEKDGKDIKKTVEMDGQTAEQIGFSRPALPVNEKLQMPLEGKKKLRLNLVELSNGKMFGNLRNTLDKFGLSDLKEEMLPSSIDATADQTLRKLRREMKVSVNRRTQNVEPAKMAQNGCPLRGKLVKKGTKPGSRTACASSHLRRTIDSTESKCSSCGKSSCHCHAKTASAQASSSDIFSERLPGLAHCGDTKFDFEAKCSMSPHVSRLCPDSDGPGVVVNEESSPCLSIPSISAASNEGWTSIDIQMSPKKALRAAMLKSRFADTIFRATHVKSDPPRIEEERKRLEREQLQEKARIEKDLKAAQAAMRMKVQDELKMRREREREAAKIALQKVEKTVEIDENLQIFKDLAEICWGSHSSENSWDGVSTGHPGKLLERFGLYMNDYLEEDEDAILDWEEGEILS